MSFMSQIEHLMAKMADREPRPDPPLLFPETLADHLAREPQPCPYPLPLPDKPIRAYLDEAEEASAEVRRNRHLDYNSPEYQALVAESYAARGRFEHAGLALRRALPFATSAAYAYIPRENVGSKGGHHIICEEPVEYGRLKRRQRDALCQPPSKRFWGLDGRGDDGRVDCLRCLDIAESIVNKEYPR